MMINNIELTLGTARIPWAGGCGAIKAKVILFYQNDAVQIRLEVEGDKPNPNARGQFPLTNDTILDLFGFTDQVRILDDVRDQKLRRKLKEALSVSDVAGSQRAKNPQLTQHPLQAIVAGLWSGLNQRSDPHRCEPLQIREPATGVEPATS